MQLALRTFTQRPGYKFSTVLPNKIGVLGYGAIGKAFVEFILANHKGASIVVVDPLQGPSNETRFKYTQHKVTQQNYQQLPELMGLEKGDFLVDLSTNIEFLHLWPVVNKHGLRYLNTALEMWEENLNAKSFPANAEEAYKTSLGYIKDKSEKLPGWNTKEGPTSVLEMGMNPGLISTFVKRALEDAAKHFIANPVQDIDKVALEKRLAERNHSKIAQLLGVTTIHCSEYDNQRLKQTPKDVKTKLYNTWSCQGLLTEGLVPIQAARGSHEDKSIDKFVVVRDGKTIMSYKPSTRVWAKSWVPNRNIRGSLIPHGEAYSIYDYLHDKETGYAPSQYYVYEFTPYAKEFILSQPETTTLEQCTPDTEVIHPMNHPAIRGIDKIGALLIMKNNRGWWTGSVMDDVDSKDLFGWKFGPTVLQVTAGVYSGFLWGCKHPNSGVRYAEFLDNDFIIDAAKPYLGRFVSTYADLSQTSIKDSHKLQDFLCDVPELERRGRGKKRSDNPIQPK